MTKSELELNLKSWILNDVIVLCQIRLDLGFRTANYSLKSIRFGVPISQLFIEIGKIWVPGSQLFIEIGKIWGSGQSTIY